MEINASKNEDINMENIDDVLAIKNLKAQIKELFRKMLGNVSKTQTFPGPENSLVISF